MGFQYLLLLPPLTTKGSSYTRGQVAFNLEPPSGLTILFPYKVLFSITSMPAPESSEDLLQALLAAAPSF